MMYTRVGQGMLLDVDQNYDDLRSLCVYGVAIQLLRVSERKEGRQYCRHCTCQEEECRRYGIGTTFRALPVIWK